MRPTTSAEVVIYIQELTTSFRTKLQKLQGKFNDPVLLARLSRQAETFGAKFISWCEQVDTEEAYGALEEFANLISDFAFACEKMSAAMYRKLNLLHMKLYEAVRFNRRRISAGHLKKVQAT